MIQRMDDAGHDSPEARPGARSGPLTRGLCRCPGSALLGLSVLSKLPRSRDNCRGGLYTWHAARYNVLYSSKDIVALLAFRLKKKINTNGEYINWQKSNNLVPKCRTSMFTTTVGPLMIVAMETIQNHKSPWHHMPVNDKFPLPQLN